MTNNEQITPQADVYFWNESALDSSTLIELSDAVIKIDYAVADVLHGADDLYSPCLFQPL